MALVVSGGPLPYQRPNLHKPIKSINRKRNKQFYDSAAWKRSSSTYLDQNPLCEDCLANGVVAAAIDVHHKRSLASGWDLRLDETNYRALCKSCHAIRTKKGE